MYSGVIVSLPCLDISLFCIFKIYFLERRKGREQGREKEEKTMDVGEKHLWVASCTPLTRDLVHNPGVCPDQESNWRPFGSQAHVQSTELQQPGQNVCLL